MRASQAQQKYKLAYNFPTFFLQIVETIEIYWKYIFQLSLKISTLIESVLQ